MSIIKRIKRIIEANIKDFLNQAEDPEITIQQMLEEMQQELRETKIQVAAAIRDQNKLEAQYKENLQKTNKWAERSVEFVKNGDDARAKKALKRKRSSSKLAESFKEQFQIQKQSVTKLKEGLNVLETKIEEVKRRKNLLITREKRAEAQRSISQIMEGISSSSANNAFNQVKDRVIDVEADAEAASEIQKLDLESRFASLEQDDEKDINEELAKLKEKVEKN